MNEQARAALRAEITADPAGRGYAGKTAAAIADLVNAGYSVAHTSVPADVATAAVKQIITPTGELFRIARQAAQVDDTPLTQAAWSFLQSIDRFDHLSTSKPTVLAAASAAMEVLTTAGLLSEDSVDAIVALTSTTPEPTHHSARIIIIMTGIEEAPNAVTADDVAGAMV